MLPTLGRSERLEPARPAAKVEDPNVLRYERSVAIHTGDDVYQPNETYCTMKRLRASQCSMVFPRDFLAVPQISDVFSVYNEWIRLFLLKSPSGADFFPAVLPDQHSVCGLLPQARVLEALPI